MHKPTHSASRLGFTLVEMLVVIAIIGVIAGLLIPVVMRAVISAKQGAHKLEVDTIAEAVEKYRNKYGDYPPDGSSWPVMERHFRKAFPQIVQSELDLLDPRVVATTSGVLPMVLPPVTAPPNRPTTAGPMGQFGTYAIVRNDFDVSMTAPTALKVMDPAEALVFFLGGFSSDPQHPFTGQGGPFAITQNIDTTMPLTAAERGTLKQELGLNLSRSNPLFEFAANQLLTRTESVIINGKKVVINYSTDEEIFHMGATPPSVIPFNTGTTPIRDLLPVYISVNGESRYAAPMVYFDSRTYRTLTYSNFYQRAALAATWQFDTSGSIRPLLSTVQARTVTRPGITLEFMEDKKFQVISPGIDGRFGGPLYSDLTAATVLSAFWTFPGGDSYANGGNLLTRKSWLMPGSVPELNSPIVATKAQFQAERASSKYSIDNCANFSAATFAQGQP